MNKKFLREARGKNKNVKLYLYERALDFLLFHIVNCSVYQENRTSRSDSERISANNKSFGEVGQHAVGASWNNKSLALL